MQTAVARRCPPRARVSRPRIRGPRSRAPAPPVSGCGLERHRDDGAQLENRVELQRLGAALHRLRCRRAPSFVPGGLPPAHPWQAVVHGSADEFVVQARDRFAARSSSPKPTQVISAWATGTCSCSTDSVDVRQMGTRTGPWRACGCDIQRMARISLALVRKARRRAILAAARAACRARMRCADPPGARPAGLMKRSMKTLTLLRSTAGTTGVSM